MNMHGRGIKGEASWMEGVLRRHHGGIMEDSFVAVCETHAILTPCVVEVGLLNASR